MISALRSNAVITEASASGADGYLYKPFKLEALLEEIQRLNALVRIRRDTRAEQGNQRKVSSRANYATDARMG